MKIRKTLATAIATGSLLLQAAVPAFAATSLVVSGNGSDSASAIETDMSTTTSVVQNNATDIRNNIEVNSNTGGNTADDNTGGQVVIDTGDASTDISVHNMANTNMAEVETCDCEGETSVLVSGNGTDTENYVGLDKTNTTGLFQTNVSRISNRLDADSNTGDNSAEDNTGGDVVVLTGDADTTVDVSTMANMNSARVAPRNGEGGSLSVQVMGNGSDSDNAVELALGRTTSVTQDNYTSIRNRINVDASTGWNRSEDNTGGMVGIDTGDAYVDVSVDNMAGFNTANVEDCCFQDVLAKVAGNGTDSENYIGATLGNDLAVWQDNYCGGGIEALFYYGGRPCFDSNLSLDAMTGDNRNEDNTASLDGEDPVIFTGNSDVMVNVGNEGGSNSYGADTGWHMPGNGMDVDLDISFSLSDLMSWFHGHMS